MESWTEPRYKSMFMYVLQCTYYKSMTGFSVFRASNFVPRLLQELTLCHAITVSIQTQRGGGGLRDVTHEIISGRQKVDRCQTNMSAQVYQTSCTDTGL